MERSLPVPVSTIRATRQSKRAQNPLISFVVPVFNEAATVHRFITAVSPTVEEAGCRAEFVFVNDGSTDQTLDVLFSLQETDSRVHIVNLSRNFGKEAAMTAGLQESLGDVAIPIDVDLQDPPELLIPFLEQWRNGYDVVYGIRVDRSSDPIFMRLTSNLFFRVFNSLTPTPIPRNVGDFRLIDRRVVEAILLMGERNRFMKGLFSWVGFPSVGVEFNRPPRSDGRTSWTPWGRWNFALDGIISFSTTPLRIWTYIGMFMAACCGLYAATIFGLAATGKITDVPGYASLIMVVLLLGAMQLISLGVIGEYLARVLTESKQRPIYLLEGVYRPEPTTTAAQEQQSSPATVTPESGQSTFVA